MNELLQKHGCSNVFSVPEGLKELMSDITREVLRIQPKRIHDFIANYLSALLITREHGIMAVKIVEDLCDCRPSVSEHLMQLGLERQDADTLAEIIKTEIELSAEPAAGKEKLKEYQLIKKILTKIKLDEEMTAQVCQVARNTYKDYWCRKNIMKQGMKKQSEEPWEIAARNTLNLYKSTKPSISELTRAVQKIQAAYRGYHVRRNVLRHLLPKKDKKQSRKVDLSGPPVDVAASREADLGPVINIRNAVQEDNVADMFDTERTADLGLAYDPHKMVQHVESDEEFLESQHPEKSPVQKSRVKMELGPKKSSRFADDALLVEHEVPKGVKISISHDTESSSKPSRIVMPSSTDKSAEGMSVHVTSEETDRIPNKLPASDKDLQPFGPSNTRISFSEVPPEVIEDLVTPDSARDDAPEVPEDIPDTSIDSTVQSGLDTTDTTDVEDEAEEEEEEE